MLFPLAVWQTLDERAETLQVVVVIDAHILSDALELCRVVVSDAVLKKRRLATVQSYIERGF
jgi:ABC-type multidrug transport system ATPase subunit